MQNIIVFISLVIVILLMSCGSSSNQESTVAKKVSGYQVYKNNCRLCHGVDGRMGLNGAKLIPDSELSLDERIEHIKNGKGAMQPYKGILSEAEIKAVAEYTMTLGKED